MTPRLLLLVIALGVVPGVAPAQERLDTAMLAKIRAEGLNRSQVVQLFDTIATVFGPRLTGSAAYVRAVNWSKDKLTEFGVSNARLESFPFGRGWELDRSTIEMVEPRYMPLVGYPEAWTPSTPGELVAAPILTAGKSYDDLAKVSSQLKGGILMRSGIQSNFITLNRLDPTDPTPPPPPRPGAAPGVRGGPQPPAPVTCDAAGNPVGRGAGAGGAGAAGGRGGAGRGAGTRAGGAAPAAPTEAQRIDQLLAANVPAVTLTASRGEEGTLFLQGGTYNRVATSSSIVLAAEHYNMIVRLLQNHVPVKLRVNVQTRFLDRDTNGYNVLGEIPGTDPRLRDQVVMIGAHIDSWHSALGAADNADGVAIVLEVMRILKKLGVQPRRTIRAALWGGEEEGLLGSKAWVQQHLANDSVARSKLSIYFNMDPGTGPIYGFATQGYPGAKAILDAWMAPFTDIGFRKNVETTIGNTDHLSFTAVCVPGFNPFQDFTDYDTRIHHTNWDTPERVPLQDLKNASVIFASLLYDAAMRDEMFPRR